MNIKQFFCGTLVLLLTFSSLPHAVYAEDTDSLPVWPSAPEVGAPGAIVMEASTGTILYNKNAYETYYPASTTKLMTALLAIEQCPLSDIVTCSHDAIYSMDWTSSRIGLAEGEQLSMEDALYAILLASANEVTYAVAEHIGGTMPEFVKLMNKRAEELGCVNTNFVNPHGLDDEAHVTCPYDLALIARQAIKYTTFRRISGSYYYEIPATNLNVARPIGNTHQIIRKKIKYDGVFAGKTGHTSLAGNSLVTCAERDGLTLICVVMNTTADGVYTDTMALLDYVFNNFHLYSLSASETVAASAFPALFEDDDTLLTEVQSPLSISNTSLVLPLDASFRDITKEVRMIPMEALNKGNNVIGEVSYYYADNYVGSAEIMYYSSKDVSFLPPVPDETASIEAFSKPQGNGSAVSAPQEERDLRPLIIGIVVGAVTLFGGFYLIFIELPYRRKKRNYQRRNRSF